MKIVKLECPKCKTVFYYTNYWFWVLHTPFHTFTKRLTKCPHCKQKTWMKRGTDK